MPFPHCGHSHTTAAVLPGHRCLKKETDESKGTETLVGDYSLQGQERLEEPLRSHPHSTCPLPHLPHALGLIGRTCPDQGEDDVKGIRSWRLQPCKAMSPLSSLLPEMQTVLCSSVMHEGQHPHGEGCVQKAWWTQVRHTDTAGA